MAQADVDRPVLAGGERLRQEVERVSGFGPKFHPWTVDEARSAIRPQIVTLASAISEIPESLRGSRFVVEASIVPNYIAASYFPQRLFDEADLVVLGSRPTIAPYRTEHGAERPQHTKAVILGATSQSLARLDRLASEEHPTRAQARLQEGFRPLRDLRLPTLEEVVREASNGERNFEAVLHPEWDPATRRIVPASRETYSKWIAFVNSLGGEVVERYRRTVGGLTFVPVVLDAGIVARAADFNPLRVLRPMPKLRPIRPTPLRSLGSQTLTPPAEAGPRSSHRVAIFDGGWDSACPYTGPFTTLHELTSESEEQELVEHGSAVTGAALFGEVRPGDALVQPPFFVDHYRVLPVPPAEEDFDLNWVLDRIVDTVRSSGHRVVNLSLGPDLPIDDGDPHRWTVELDQLAAERDVLFVVSVGNNGEADPDNGLDRIQVPGDLVNGVGVGACTQSGSGTWARAPYSAVGPGRQGARVKPTGVAFGGDGGSNPYTGLGMAGAIYQGHGTSFAAPLVTRSVGSMLQYQSPTGSAVNLLRAMAVHYTDADPDLRVEDVGYGRFHPNLEERLSCGPDTVTVLYQDTLSRGDVVGLPIPLPDGLSGRIGIRWTLAITSPVDPADMAEYTQAGVELQFRPHSRAIPFTAPDNSRTYVVNVDRDSTRATELLRQGYRPADNAATRSGNRVRVSELTRRDEGKWETMIHASDRLLARSLFQPRLDLSYFARSRGMLRDEGVPDLDFALLVTIEARSGQSLYDLVRTTYSVLTPIEIQVQPRVRVT